MHDRFWLYPNNRTPAGQYLSSLLLESPLNFPYPQNGNTILHSPNLADDACVITSRDSVNTSIVSSHNSSILKFFSFLPTTTSIKNVTTMDDYLRRYRSRIRKMRERVFAKHPEKLALFDEQYDTERLRAQEEFPGARPTWGSTGPSAGPGTGLVSTMPCL